MSAIDQQAGDRPDGQDVLLDVSDLKLVFGGVVAVNDVSLKVRRGSILGLMGPNGAGKTSLVNLVTGFYKPNAGSIRFNDTEIAGAAPHRIARLGVTRTYQNVRLFSGMTVLEQVVSGMYAHRKALPLGSLVFSGKERRDRAEAVEQAHALLDEVGVPDREVLAERLSYGTQRRVEIARALATRPGLVLLDEPTAGMNHAESTDIGALMHTLRDRGCTVVVVEHNMRLILDYCDEAYVMSFGSHIASGAPAECVEDPAVQAAYFGKESHVDVVSAASTVRSD